MGETRVNLPLFTESEWEVMLTGLSLAEVKGREDLQYRRIYSTLLEQSTKGLPVSALPKAPTQEQIKEANDLGKHYNAIKEKIYRLREGLTKLDQQNTKQVLDAEIDKLLGGASEVQ